MDNSNELRLHGTVLSFNETLGFGFIKDENGVDRGFFLSNVRNSIILPSGTKVTFIPSKNRKNQEAAKNIIPDNKEDIKNIDNDLVVLKKIDDSWMLEAKSENILKFFYNIDEHDQLTATNKCYVIGRKGTGKTALAEYIYNKQDYNCFSERLNFKNFPFNEIYVMSDNKFTFQNQYITIWKYLIYGSLLKMMSTNERIDPSLLSILRKIFPVDPIDSLKRKFEHLTKFSFSIELFGTTLSTGASQSKNEKELTWIEQADIFENLILNYIDDSKYYIILDALDDDYNNLSSEEKGATYLALLTGLFKAIQDIKTIFPTPQFSFHPIVFIRDDIYRRIKDSDKTKWEDYSINMVWNSDKIKSMLAYRISKTLDDQILFSFEDAWSKLFHYEYVETLYGRKNSFDTVCQSTFMRPRDFIQFIKICCKNALNNPNKQITPRIYRDSLIDFSHWLRSEIEYEMKEVIPDIEEVMSVISKLRKREFKSYEFDYFYEQAVKAGKMRHKFGSEVVLSTLFQYNVIGNKTRNGSFVFFLNNSHATFNHNETIAIQRGLYNSFDI